MAYFLTGLICFIAGVGLGYFFRRNNPKDPKITVKTN